MYLVKLVRGLVSSYVRGSVSHSVNSTQLCLQVMINIGTDVNWKSLRSVHIVRTCFELLWSKPRVTNQTT